jgi:hypothetical protein
MVRRFMMMNLAQDDERQELKLPGELSIGHSSNDEGGFWKSLAGSKNTD